MSRLSELIEELCPNGVEYKTLGEMASILRGASPRPIKNFITTDEDGVNWIKIGDVKAGSKYITGTAEKITKEGAKKSRFVKEGDFILSNSMSFGRPYIVKTEGCIHDGWLVISDFNNYFIPDFLYHLLNSNKYQQLMRQKASFGGAVQNLNADIVRALEMPVPPLEVQREIVRILDSYTEKVEQLKLELNAELDARKKQYELYRGKMLTFDEKIHWESLGNTCELVTGATPSKTRMEYWEYGTISWMSSGEVNNKRIFSTEAKITQLGYDNASTTLVPIHSVVIALAGQGKTRGKVAITEIELCTNQSICSIVCGDKILYKFLYYFLDSKYEELRAISNGDGSRGGLSLRILSPYKIPVPSLEKQREIINFLDSYIEEYEALQSNLVAEIETRQKQYEYHRDKLLTFQEVK